MKYITITKILSDTTLYKSKLDGSFRRFCLVATDDNDMPRLVMVDYTDNTVDIISSSNNRYMQDDYNMLNKSYSAVTTVNNIHKFDTSKLIGRAFTDTGGNWNNLDMGAK